MTDSNEIFVLGRKVRLLQPAKGFRTSIDSVLLAASCPVKKGQTVLDMGCGVGGVTFCILYRVPDCHVTGVEVQKEYYDLARGNAELNGVDATFVHRDIRDFSPESCFDHVVFNPPFLESGTHVPSPEETLAKARGHQEADLSLKDWIDAGRRNLKQGGRLTIIHRADMTDRVIRAMGERFGAVEIFPLWPKAGQIAKRVIIRAIKDRKSPAVIHNGLILHENGGGYTEAAELVLREGQALF